MNEIEEGVGRSSKAFFIILKTGFSFMTWVFIKKMTKLFGLDDAREWKELTLLRLKPSLK